MMMHLALEVSGRERKVVEKLMTLSRGKSIDVVGK